MARTCSICAHPRRGEIDEALLGGLGYAEVSRRFAAPAISRDSVERHARAHIGAVLAKARGAAEELHGDALLEKVKQLERDARRIARRAEKDGDLRCAIAAVRQLADLVSLAAKLVQAGEERGQKETADEIIGRIAGMTDEELERLVASYGSGGRKPVTVRYVFPEDLGPKPTADDD